MINFINHGDSLGSHLAVCLIVPLLSEFPQEKYGLGTRLQRQRPGAPISALAGLS